MQITYDLDHVFYPGADMVMNIHTLRCMVEMNIQMNLVVLWRARQLNIVIPPLYKSGVRYQRDTLWRPIPALYRRGRSDCKNLTPAYIAEQRMRGLMFVPAFRWVENADGSIDYHILAQLGSEFEDPNRKLGMGEDEVAKFYAASAKAA
jgi:hypothetical protein